MSKTLSFCLRTRGPFYPGDPVDTLSSVGSHKLGHSTARCVFSLSHPSVLPRLVVRSQTLEPGFSETCWTTLYLPTLVYLWGLWLAELLQNAVLNLHKTYLLSALEAQGRQIRLLRLSVNVSWMLLLGVSNGREETFRDLLVSLAKLHISFSLWLHSSKPAIQASKRVSWLSPDQQQSLRGKSRLFFKTFASPCLFNNNKTSWESV